MREIESKVCGAFVAGRVDHLNNTVSTGNELYLHGNLIAKREGGKIMATLAGWNTPTTRSRINAVSNLIGGKGGVCTRKGIAMFNGKEISENEWFTLKDY